MKKLLSLLAATGLVATSGSVAVACNKKTDDKSATTKKDLATITGDSLKLAPEANDQAAAEKAVIDQIKAKLTVTVVKTTDVVFSDFKAAESSDKAGSIVVTAAEKSTLVTGKATFALTFKAAESSSVKKLDDITPKELAPDDQTVEKAKAAATAAIVAYASGAKETTDYVFGDFKAAESSDKAGSLVVTAASDSKLLSGTVTFSLKFKAAESSSVKKLDDITPKELAPDDQTVEKAKAAATAAIVAYASGAKETTDYVFGDFKAAESSDKAGSLVVTAGSGSKLLSGKITFILKFKG
ncbi:hypothetical protein SHELI_v1c10040 [Spiroplasma helicoides]|uniref:Spiralin n=1 Tax=Spiroplasma helicoides TaxID=216938 RepID=A0A1B3SLY5_9MOLU|nr:lipoprotein [Spiroplasma helicoides]AOG60951.1 hypothetical protein SHELI_v1c10040 [Spiroplasma helicoides]